MSECKTGTSCDTETSCRCPNCGQEECCCTMAEDMLCLVKCAKHDLLKEKMKKLLETKIGKKLDKVAEVAVEAVLAKMQRKIAEKNACEKYKDDLTAAFKS
jgi:hypothetical protein